MKVLLLALLGAVAVTTHGEGRAPAATPCRPSASPAYADRVERATSARTDAWGNLLVRAPAGPTYSRMRSYLAPLLYAGAPKQRPLTRSGVYYLAFGEPSGPEGGGQVALHVADGSEIVSGHVGGPSLEIGVGDDGREPFGSCLSRLAPPTLDRGYLPILENTYTDAAGVRYRQESFAARVPETSALVSFVRLMIDAPTAPSSEEVRITPSGSGSRLFSSAGGHWDGPSLVYPVAQTHIVELARLVRPAPSGAIALDDGAYARARTAIAAYWHRRLAHGALYSVPDRRIDDAERNLLIQNLLLTWRYSVGNPYETFEFPESLENAAVMAEYGFGDVARDIVEQSFHREPQLYPSWEAATRLLAAARYAELLADRRFVAASQPALRRNAALLERRLGVHALLRPERYTADLPDVAYGLDEQTVGWAALGAIARVWAAAGDLRDAAAARAAAIRLAPPVRSAVARSERRLPDGSLFIPARLLDGEQPYASLARSLHGSYWNLVAPDALASGFFVPHGAEASGALAYLLRHGSRLLGLVRARAYALYGHDAPDAAGTDEVYGLNVSRFLADNDRPDQLVLSLYGELAAAMTENTFVSGEGATVTPLDGGWYRSMYLPPNSTSNAAFLETLRLMLVHETRDALGAPVGLELAYATPKGWLAPGTRIDVRQAPTDFGTLSYTIVSHRRTVEVHVCIPSRTPPRSIRLRLRRPGEPAIARVTVNGRTYTRFDGRAETIDLSGLSGTAALEVSFAR